MDPRSLDHAATRTRRDELGRLEVHVRRRLGGRIRDFHLTLTNDRLVLHGRAPSFHVKQLAQHVVMQATSLPIAENQIEVLS
ncbi:MAG: hypothetical protein NZO58_02900 [Gemmataceae bacterium]|nr:hypothetical protein [Gemmataceae bacterium]